MCDQGALIARLPLTAEFEKLVGWLLDGLPSCSSDCS